MLNPICMPPEHLLRSWVFSYNPLDLVLICSPIPSEEVVCVSLSWRVGVGVIEKVLNSEEDLLDGDGRLPALLFIQDRQADGARGIDVGVEERWDEFAWTLSAITPSQRGMRTRTRIIHFGGFVGYSATNVSFIRLPGASRKDSPSGKITLNLNRPPSQSVFSLPGIPHSQVLRSRTP